MHHDKVPATVAWNYPIQTTAASIMDLALVGLKRDLVQRTPEASLMAQVHDALYVLCPEDDAPLVSSMLEEHMRMRLRLSEDGPEMDFVATAKVGKNWMEVS